MATFEMLENYSIAPFSNITNWAATPQLYFDTTPAGSVLFDARTPSGYAYPAAEYSPGITSQLYVNGQSKLEYPRTVPVKTDRWTTTLDAYVNSPGYATPECTLKITVTHDSLLGEVGGALSGAFDFFDFCGFTRLC